MFFSITSSLKTLPNYLIIGAQKSGTSSLFYYLSQHPQVKNSKRKELHYFDKNFNKPLLWYKQFFPYKIQINSKTAIGEATPNYLFHPNVPQRIKKILPNVKMIILLRNPTERVISQYFQAVRKNNETKTLMESLLEEEHEEKKILIKLSQDEYYYPQHAHVLYKSRSRYVEQLQRYFDIFDRDQFLILSSKELLTKPNESLKKVCNFLNINSHFYLREISLLNVGTNKTKISNEILEYLDNYFKPYNEALFNLLGYKIDW